MPQAGSPHSHQAPRHLLGSCCALAHGSPGYAPRPRPALPGGGRAEPAVGQEPRRACGSPPCSTCRTPATRTSWVRPVGCAPSPWRARGAVPWDSCCVPGASLVLHVRCHADTPRYIFVQGDGTSVMCDRTRGHVETSRRQLRRHREGPRGRAAKGICPWAGPTVAGDSSKSSRGHRTCPRVCVKQGQGEAGSWRPGQGHSGPSVLSSAV